MVTATRPADVEAQNRILAKLVTELDSCADRHDDCKECGRVATCRADYDYLLGDLIGLEAEVRRFVEDLRDEA